MARMTLKEFAEKWQYNIREHPSGAMWTPDKPSDPIRCLAWLLEDYVVSSVIAGVIWFSPRNGPIS